MDPRRFRVIEVNGKGRVLTVMLSVAFTRTMAAALVKSGEEGVRIENERGVLFRWWPELGQAVAR